MDVEDAITPGALQALGTLVRSSLGSGGFHRTVVVTVAVVHVVQVTADDVVDVIAVHDRDVPAVGSVRVT